MWPHLVLFNASFPSAILIDTNSWEVFNFPSNCVVRKSLKKQEQTKGLAVTLKTSLSTCPCPFYRLFMFRWPVYSTIQHKLNVYMCFLGVKNICPACLLTNKAWGEAASGLNELRAAELWLQVSEPYRKWQASSLSSIITSNERYFLSSLYMFIEK